MHRSGPDLLVSATDLAGYSACAHKTWLDRLKALGLAKPFGGPDARLDLLRKRGYEHEERVLAGLEAEGKRIVRFPELDKGERTPEGYARRAAETERAMADGADVIHQGTLFDGRWMGHVDFLIKVEDSPSAFGAWSYEVADAKLAREAKATAVLQTCAYSEMLTRVQGREPERVYLYLGGSTQAGGPPRRKPFRLAHYAAYYRSLKRRFDAHLEGAPDEMPIAPDPVELCDVCDWRSRCQRERREVDHLALVAGITRAHRRALQAAGVSTLAGLARLPLGSASAKPPEGIRAKSFERIREQARVQLTGRERGAPYEELLPLEANGEGPPLGLAALPAPHPADWFFDFEGADYAHQHGLEYLWGISWVKADGTDDYRCTWALTPEAEKAALERFLQEAEALVAEHPGAHIYHFGHYEATALKRLVGRYGVGTDALDRLLTKQVFVDLHRIVKQGVRASVESYSLKKLEPHFAFERAVPLDDAGPARARLEIALAMGLRGEEELADCPVVEGYNKDDCIATRALRDWLEGLRAELEAKMGVAIPRPGPPEPKEDKEREIAAEVAELMRGLLDGVPEERELRSDAEHVRWLTAHLLEWHRREDKTAWWDYFRLRDLSVDELIEETKPLAGLEYVGVVGKEARSLIHRFRLPDQDHRFRPGDKGIDPQYASVGAEDESAAKEDEDDSLPRRTVWAIDGSTGTVDLKVGRDTSWEPSALRVLIRDEIVGAKGQKARLRKAAHKLIDSEGTLAAWSPASVALLYRRAPRFSGNVSGRGGADPDAPRIPLPAFEPTAGLLQRSVAAALHLQDGVLPVQGPPGSGKTYSGARMVRALLRAGLRVGVTGPSHKVITNLLDAICEADEDDPPTVIDGLQAKKKSESGCTDSRFVLINGSSGLERAEAKRATAGLPPFNLIAGTAWLWSREDREHASGGGVDVLFIDEAGQFSLANALAIAPAAPKLILLGDPQQLNQPQKGLHPPGTEVSVLEHLAGVDGILDPEEGLFLGETWRMRPEITAFTSELFYESKLASRADLSAQRLTLADGSTLHGLVFHQVGHEGNSRASEEEAREVVGIFTRLLARGSTFTNRHGKTRPLKLNDLLVVAPYNAQVDLIREALAAAGFPDARVGTVDKFQGQEAPVAIYSLASSSAEDAPRGMEFLYALDRLNVATSRARVCTIVVASPELLVAECKRPEQMRLVNAVVRYGEMASGTSAGPSRPTRTS